MVKLFKTVGALYMILIRIQFLLQTEQFSGMAGERVRVGRVGWEGWLKEGFS